MDVKSKKILSMEITDERTGDGGMLKPLVQKAQEQGTVERGLADGAR